MDRLDGKDKIIELKQNIRFLQLFVIVISIHFILGIIFFFKIIQVTTIDLWFPYYCFGMVIIGLILMYKEYLVYKRNGGTF